MKPSHKELCTRAATNHHLAVIHWNRIIRRAPSTGAKMDKVILTKEQADSLREVRNGIAAKINAWADIEGKVSDLCQCGHNPDCPVCDLFGMACEILPRLNEFAERVEMYLMQRPTV